MLTDEKLFFTQEQTKGVEEIEVHTYVTHVTNHMTPLTKYMYMYMHVDTNHREAPEGEVVPWEAAEGTARR